MLFWENGSEHTGPNGLQQAVPAPMDREGLAEPAQGQAKGLSPGSASPNNRDPSRGPAKRERLPLQDQAPALVSEGKKREGGREPREGEQATGPHLHL